MENSQGEENSSGRRKIDKKMSEGWGNRNRDSNSTIFLVSPSFFFPFFLPPPSHFYLCTVFLLPSLFTHHAPCWITHAYLTVLHLQKQWTYSLAFRVLMKAPIVVASLLFLYTSSKPVSSWLTSPAPYYAIGSASILNLDRLACIFPLVPCLVQEFNYRGTDVYGLEPSSVWEMWQSPHGVFYPFILHPIHPRLLY